MKLSTENIKLLGLSAKETEVLKAIKANHNTPLLVSEAVNVSRVATYEIIGRLHKRGLIKSYIIDGKKYWKIAREKDIEKIFYNTKREILGIAEDSNEILGLGDSAVIVHRGAEAIIKLMKIMIKDHKDRRLIGVQGDVTVIGWNKIFGVEGTNELNRNIKKNRIITEAIVSDGWFERQTKSLGKQWAIDFEGRMAATYEIPEKYLESGGQIFIFKNSLYLMDMNEAIIIEVRNSEIQKIVYSMITFVENHAKKIDVNTILRKLIAGVDK